jgi:hypothetical protein
MISLSRYTFKSYPSLGPFTHLASNRQIEDLKATPAQAPNSTLSAPEQALKELDKALNAPSLQSSSAAVNDLTGMVKKKKEKRKAEGEVDMNDGKKLKME